MESHPPQVHPVDPAERALVWAKKAIKRSGAAPVARKLVLRITRQTYARTLALVTTRDELPRVFNARRFLGVGAEIGVAYGEFSEHILSIWNGEKLISVDPWIEMAPEEYVDTCNQNQDSMERAHETAARRLAAFKGRSEIWRETGHEACARVAPRSLDFVYIDAQHSYEAVVRDLADWFPLVRSGGIIAGHDYNDGVFTQGIHGVRSAVDGFFGERRMRVFHTYGDIPFHSWMVSVP